MAGPRRGGPLLPRQRPPGGGARHIYAASRTRQSTWGELFANGFETFDKNPSGYRIKHMLALNFEQEFTDDLGAFA